MRKIAYTHIHPKNHKHVNVQKSSRFFLSYTIAITVNEMKWKKYWCIFYCQWFHLAWILFGQSTQLNWKPNWTYKVNLTKSRARAVHEIVNSLNRSWLVHFRSCNTTNKTNNLTNSIVILCEPPRKMTSNLIEPRAHFFQFNLSVQSYRSRI